MKQITLNKVGYAYDTEWILEDLNLTIQQGDGCILLTGKNGAGKSTLLNVVCGLIADPKTPWKRARVVAIHNPAVAPQHPLELGVELLMRHRSFIGTPKEVVEMNHGQRSYATEGAGKGALTAAGTAYDENTQKSCGHREAFRADQGNGRSMLYSRAH